MSPLMLILVIVLLVVLLGGGYGYRSGWYGGLPAIRSRSTAAG